MLKRLTIDNFAIIDHVELELQSGFTVLTGETGSGKSILLNALNLVTGDRADYSIIGPGKDKAIVEAELDITGFGLRGFFELNEIDYAECTILRREINKEGRSRAFVNDTPVQLVLLREIGSRLLHIHSQYNTLELKDRNFQLELLDILAGSAVKRDLFSTKYHNVQALRTELSDLLARKANAAKEQEFIAFQLTDIGSIDLDNVNYSELEERHRLFESGDELRTIFSELIAIQEGENGFVSRLIDIKSKLSRKVELGSRLENFSKRIEHILFEMKELSSDSERELERLVLDPQEMAQISDQLDEYNRLLFKYKCTDQTELRDLKAELKGSLVELEHADERINDLEKEIAELNLELASLGQELHDLRTLAARRIEEELALELENLKLPDCKLVFELERKETMDRSGMTDLNMMFSANSGIPPVPIQKAASGGELSRVMLALQYLISQKTQLQTILFDEIDTGVSGDVAARIGQTLLKMGERMQVLAITHLPQVAGKGQYHFKVSKSLGANGKVQTTVIPLVESDRVDEIARLMSGDTITDGARSNAKALMNS